MLGSSSTQGHCCGDQGPVIGKRRRQPGLAAAKRRRAGGKQAVGRPSLSLVEYRATKEAVLLRANHRCESCGSDKNLTPDHVKPRSQGGSDDANNLVVLCWSCHRQKEAPYAKGRLLIKPAAPGCFHFTLAIGPSKHDYDPVVMWTSGAGVTVDVQGYLRHMRAGL